MNTTTQILSTLGLADCNRAYAVAGYLALKPRCEKRNEVRASDPTPRLQEATRASSATLPQDYNIKITSHRKVDHNINPRKRTRG